MSVTIERLSSELTSHRFGGRWRRAWFYGTWILGFPASMVFFIGIAASFAGNGRIMEHPIAMILFGTWTDFLGVMLLVRPRTYVEYIRLQYCLRRIQRGGQVDEAGMQKGIRRETMVAMMGGLLALFVGSCIIVGGIGKL